MALLSLPSPNLSFLYPLEAFFLLAVCLPPFLSSPLSPEIRGEKIKQASQTQHPVMLSHSVYIKSINGLHYNTDDLLQILLNTLFQWWTFSSLATITSPSILWENSASKLLLFFFFFEFYACFAVISAFKCWWGKWVYVLRDRMVWCARALSPPSAPRGQTIALRTKRGNFSLRIEFETMIREATLCACVCVTVEFGDKYKPFEKFFYPSVCAHTAGFCAYQPPACINSLHRRLWETTPTHQS